MIKNKKFNILLFTTLIIAICSIIYELIIGSISSYLLGDSVKQFSITIGLYMSMMGVGSFFSKKIEKNIFAMFVKVEIILGIIGGFSSLLLFFAFIYLDIYNLVMYFLICSLGFLVGLEIPFLIRIINENNNDLKENIANLFAFDYLGGLVGSIIFPVILLPKIGFISTSFLVGLLNLLMALLIVTYFGEYIAKSYKPVLYILICIFSILTLMGNKITNSMENGLYRDQIIHKEQTLYQKIVVTKHKDDLRLFLDGNIQFSEKDEYRYHEPLVHIPMSLGRYENILILGGGDGLCARELLKYEYVKKITLIDIDQEMVELCKNNPFIQKINNNSLINEKVELVYQDAFAFLKNTNEKYDLIITDLPDPNNEALNKLYTTTFYKFAKSALAENGAFITQATSPYYAKDTFWCINKTVGDVFPYTFAYHSLVPSFGDWGFCMATNSDIDIDKISLNPGLAYRYLNNDTVRSLFDFSEDLISNINIEINTIFKPILIRYYSDAIKNW